MPLAVLMTGVPGSGKSRVRDHLVSLLPEGFLTVIAPDDIVEDVGSRLGMTYRQVYDNQHLKDYCYNRSWGELAQKAAEGKNLLIDRTHIDAAYRRKTMDFINQRAPERYTFHALTVVTPPAPVWVRRLDQRVDKLIPADVLFNFARSFEAPTHDEGFAVTYEGTSDEVLAGDEAFCVFSEAVERKVGLEAADPFPFTGLGVLPHALDEQRPVPAVHWRSLNPQA